ncbi:uncharacterized protein ASPGLDRAFT_39708 [Aspergillus glaucus CBS 516.65]|uniref:Uncharacterized protein n=1 Tax=Aspergillus glaucus CBS 516.65 TaxID=1160497 RepID=A0A1L9V6W9_ASPGL|nr:hypothetical protein ASPGLDRAFT_39708 [Aspergillus glaucus CBS 516.65]OJJ79602.1 hypothetical protein ASPGLDRAFT_39708 [Aspergillus glaucus CBS 516.65]
MNFLLFAVSVHVLMTSSAVADSTFQQASNASNASIMCLPICALPIHEYPDDWFPVENGVCDSACKLITKLSKSIDAIHAVMRISLMNIGY